MKRTRIAGLILGVLLVAGVAQAGITTITSTLDYEDNAGWDGPWFIPPDITLDHSPYYRGMTEDWGWTHSIIDQVPVDALAIRSAQLEIYAWDVDANYYGGNYEGPEVDIIYANGVALGSLEDTEGRLWKATTFELPDEVLEELWADGEVYVYIDIDTISDMAGHRVTLKYATLTVEYQVSGPGDPLQPPVYRFWSPVYGTHFYTADEDEKDEIENEQGNLWTYEGVAYHALSGASEPNSAPIYRFWSTALSGHFYTISERERDKIINKYPDVWEYEQIAFYAFPVDEQPEGTIPVYRFWSPTLRHHFYTVSETEKQKVEKEYPDVWVYEGIAWYAYK